MNDSGGTTLNAHSLLSFQNLPRPTYDRQKASIGIVHFGVGGFHRAHQAMYLDRLMEGENALDWGICGVGIMPADQKMRDVMQAQDCLYTLVLKNAEGEWEPRIIGSIIRYLFAPDDPEAVIETMADPDVRIVSLTVTEGGYNFDHVTGEFDGTQPDIVADLSPGAVPRTAFGLITAALSRRRARGIEPFTVMSCDNIQGNGNIAARSFTAFAALQDPSFGRWIAENVSFPNSMVDRITPVTTASDRTEISARFDIADEWPVVAEPYVQWVLEDRFPAGRPHFEAVGVQLVDNVEPYELMKLRLLNLSHQALCYFGYLAGYRFVHDVCRDPLFVDFLLAYMDDEATPTLLPVPGIDLHAYKRGLIERFSNAGVRDTVARLCSESSDRIPKWLLPVIKENLDAGRDVTISAAIVASWARYAEGRDEDGEPIDVVDRLKESVTAAARRQSAEPLAFLENRSLFGDLINEPRFTAPYLAVLDHLHRSGARATLIDLMHRR